MDTLIFNILRYFLLFLFVTTGLQITQIIKRDQTKSFANYWRFLLPPMLLYSFMEGTRWNRAADYMYNYNIANLIEKSNDPAYDFFAQILNIMGFPWIAFFIAISFLLIYSLYKYIENFREGIIPMIVLLYQFSMGQSENLMRQYAAASLILISFACLHNSKFKQALFSIILACFTHSSALFVIPFACLAISFKIPKLQESFIYRNLDIFFLISFFSASILSQYFSSNIEQLVNIAGFGGSEKYFSEEYLMHATAEASSTNVTGATDSLLNSIRNFIRNIFVIIIGKRAIETYLKKDSRKFSMFFTWFFACCGIVYQSSLPKLEMEVIARLSLYLEFFIYVIEGYLIYLYWNKERYHLDPQGKYITLIAKSLLCFELVPILKWKVAGSLGLMFTWTLDIGL